MIGLRWYQQQYVEAIPIAATAEQERNPNVSVDPAHVERLKALGYFQDDAESSSTIRRGRDEGTAVVGE